MRGLRIVQIGHSVAASYCGRLFAGTGAEVLLLEPESGSPLRLRGPSLGESGRSGLHEYLNGGKRSVLLDPSGAEFDELVRWADLVISDCDGRPEEALALHARIEALNAAAVHVVVSGFGLTGPLATWRSTPLIDWAAGGYLYITGSQDRSPIQGGGPWASYLTGSTAAIGAQAALFHAARTGEGQLVDISAMESVASGHQWTLTMFTHTGAVKGRWGARFGEAHHPMGLYEAKDGRWVCIGAPSREQWENFCISVDAVELLADDALYAPGVRFERAEEIDVFTRAWLAERTATEAVDDLQGNRVPASRVLNFFEVLEEQQLHERGFFSPRPDIHPDALVPTTPFGLGAHRQIAPAPALGEAGQNLSSILAAPRPCALPEVDLRSIRVVEFSVAWAGPLAGRFLGDLGLDVIKVEHPTSRGLGTAGFSPGMKANGDWAWGALSPPNVRAEVYPEADPGDHPWNRMGIWNKMNRGKRSLCVDAKAAGGADVLDRLIASADLLFHNFSPRGAKSLGIDHARLLDRNPEIISVAMTGYGETGAMAAHASYGPILEAFAGFDEATGYSDLGPIRIGLAFPDAVGGVHGAFAILAAIWEQRILGGPLHVDLSQLETLLSFAGELLLAASVEGRAPARIENSSSDFSPQGVYPCLGHDRWLAVSVEDDAQWAGLVEVIGSGELTAMGHLSVHERRASAREIDALIAAWTQQHDNAGLAERLQRVGVAACPVFDARDLVESPHLAERGFMVELDHVDVGPRLFPGTPLRLSRTPVVVRPSPALGDGNKDLTAELGFSSKEVAAMEAAGVLAVTPP
jgi:crotonobetainyl-CoA:carnitine CoA-transferase CaiB-like acyl-CoA transferase